MEIKAPTTTAQPQPPSGGVYPTGPPTAGAISAHKEGEDGDEGGDEVKCRRRRTAEFREEEA